MSERKVEIGNNRFTEVFCLDDPGPGGACHAYDVRTLDGSAIYASVHFQKGGIKEAGRNGCHNEDLLAIVLDRLRGFQSGDFSCRKNALAITKIEEALHWLNHRTNERIKRGVEGVSVE